ncbi:NAD-dependent epimerase/dehydratase family protein [Variovorax ginsengisoli]|uniref:NAD-dependent epimerase/dehydratase family protein n=1 Tax=Variovorax ginsengisoli TaxID=363844 RepID=A0ABT8SCP3_9BURK|nr:NAD-dependent epimerase/dehydratase family protein [Variovorax ginsengisoli]MDN8616797.1 NAD-dependent epimerase/dehydratase family protein [Variovorax ginsengisoli]MDO1535967.1 NAD-dependent epimerase/dehydratase family protein [Variovorax ginsengisoli]
MPSINSPLGARPSRFRRERVLVVGCGDVGMRAAGLLRGRLQLIALTSSPARVPQLRQAGLTPIVADLDQPASLRRLSGLATRVLHLAPPARVEEGAQWWRDARTLALARALRLRSLPSAFVYGSTSGVYGNCGGALVAETRVLRPETPRAHRRVDAERTVRWLGRAGVAVRILRIPGIYAPDREGGTPRERLRRGTPVLRAEDDVYTNHIHADDLARACVAALWRGGPQRAFHASDDSEIKMGDYIDLAARLYGLPLPPRIARDEAQAQLPLSLLSFMGESRRLDNTRLKRELRLRLRYPTVAAGLASG